MGGRLSEMVGEMEERCEESAVEIIIFLHLISLCADINECSSNNGGCAHTCTNSPGSFQCSCRTGYTLAGNGRSCNGKTAVLKRSYSRRK